MSRRSAPGMAGTLRAPTLATLFGIAALTSTLPSTARASGTGAVAVLPPSGVGVHEAHLAATQELLVSHLRATGKYHAFVVPGEPGRYEPPAAEAIGRGREHSAAYAAVVHVTRLGATARVRLSIYEVGSGRVWHDELAASGPDDIDKILHRMAVGFSTGKPARESADIESVTQRESSPLLKRRASSTFGIKLGMAAPVIDGEMLDLPGASAYWMYDMRSFLAELEIGFHAGDDGSDFFAAINGYYPFTRGNTTPYLGGGLRLQGSDYGDDDEGGLAAAATGGILFGRLSSVQLRAELSYFVTGYTVEAGEYVQDRYHTSHDGLAHGLMAHVGIGF